MRWDIGKVETVTGTNTKKQAFVRLCTCTLTNEHLCSHSHFAANTHIQRTSFPPVPKIGPQTSELFSFSIVTRRGRGKKQKKKKKTVDLNGIIT